MDKGQHVSEIQPLLRALVYLPARKKTNKTKPIALDKSYKSHFKVHAFFPRRFKMKHSFIFFSFPDLLCKYRFFFSPREHDSVTIFKTSEFLKIRVYVNLI